MCPKAPTRVWTLESIWQSPNNEMTAMVSIYWYIHSNNSLGELNHFIPVQARQGLNRSQQLFVFAPWALWCWIMFGRSGYFNALKSNFLILHFWFLGDCFPVRGRCLSFSHSLSSIMALTCCIWHGQKSVFVWESGDDHSVCGNFGRGLGC